MDLKEQIKTAISETCTHWLISDDIELEEVSKKLSKEFETIINAEIERRKETSDEPGNCNKPHVTGSCVSCHYSGNGAHGCNRLMDGATPKIDKSKGVECAHNGYSHYLPFSHER